ncbi:hypothetical protein PHK61_18665 [Actinomycetospora lutea]|uniref:hypothetical protein n=1 Tax=Actinomycetospora lutea TaxID=663604 RepID=UPI00236583BA|nr:hypothetical protein [Actinomycetospora lutea]MDD7940451.1 hypothetical protein [Actinomycetospora lutea]
MGLTGRRWWDAVAGVWQLDAHEIEMLRRVVAVADRIEALEALVADQGFLADGRDGPKAHPALTEIRQCEALLGKLVAGLRVPDRDGVRPQTRGGHRSAHQGRRTYRSGVGRIGPVPS